MRLVLNFWFMALFFGLVTEGMDVWFDGKEFSIAAAFLRGILFSALMTGFFLWKARRDEAKEAPHGE